MSIWEEAEKHTGRNRKEAEMSEIQKEIKITGLNIKM